MRNFILRRLLQTLPMLLLASFIIFLLFAKTLATLSMAISP